MPVAVAGCHVRTLKVHVPRRGACLCAVAMRGALMAQDEGRGQRGRGKRQRAVLLDGGTYALNFCGGLNAPMFFLIAPPSVSKK